MTLRVNTTQNCISEGDHLCEYIMISVFSILNKFHFFQVVKAASKLFHYSRIFAFILVSRSLEISNLLSLIAACDKVEEMIPSRSYQAVNFMV